MIDLERALPGEIQEPFDQRVHQTLLLDIGRKLVRWTGDNREALRNFDPKMPEGSFNRRADKWRALFSIAQFAGGDWPEMVKQAYLVEEREAEKNPKLSTALQLLSDIREVLKPHEHKIPTEELIVRLCDLDETPWPDYNFKERDRDRRKIQSRQISNLLTDYKITPGTIRIGNATQRGYYRTHFEIAWNRYLSPVPPRLADTPTQPNNGAASGDLLPATKKEGVSDRKTLQANNGAACVGVSARTTPIGKENDKNGDFELI